MAKREYTVYTCDRCGTQIDDGHWLIGHHKFMHIFKWWMPVECRYKLLYLCPDCMKSFEKWVNVDGI